MPFRNSSGPSSRMDATTIAQRFNAGTGQSCVAPVPKGRLTPSSAGRVPLRPALGRPFGTWGHLTAKPSVETLGYSRTSLRDDDRRPGRGNFRKALGFIPFTISSYPDTREHAGQHRSGAAVRPGVRRQPGQFVGNGLALPVQGAFLGGCGFRRGRSRLVLANVADRQPHPVDRPAPEKDTRLESVVEPGKSQREARPHPRPLPRGEGETPGAV